MMTIQARLDAAKRPAAPFRLPRTILPLLWLLSFVGSVAFPMMPCLCRQPHPHFLPTSIPATILAWMLLAFAPPARRDFRVVAVVYVGVSTFLTAVALAGALKLW